MFQTMSIFVRKIKLHKLSNRIFFMLDRHSLMLKECFLHIMLTDELFIQFIKLEVIRPYHYYEKVKNTY